MEKNRIHKIQSGKNVRMSFQGQKDILEMPDLIEIQKKSYESFCNEGLKQLFKEISPITVPNSPFQVDFTDVYIDIGDKKKDDSEKDSDKKDKKKKCYTIEECKERQTTYSAPLYADVRILKITKNPETGVEEIGDVRQSPVFMGDIPLMTDSGSFVINGAERVIVSQIVRSPGIYFPKPEHDKYGTELYSSQIIPTHGEWLEYMTDANNAIYLKDFGAARGSASKKAKRISATLFVRALDKRYALDEDLVDLFGEDIRATIEKDFGKNVDPLAVRGDNGNIGDEREAYHLCALYELFKKVKPGDPCTRESAENLINQMFFDARRYDLGMVGRFKYNKKLNYRYWLEGRTLAEDVVDEYGELIASKGQVITRELGQTIQDSGVEYVFVEVTRQDKDGASKTDKIKLMSSRMVDIKKYQDELPKNFKPEDYGITEMVYYPVLRDLIERNREEKWSKETYVKEIKAALPELLALHITKEEIVATLSYLLGRRYGIGQEDDIDHLGNRRIRAVGELVRNQFRTGLGRVSRSICEHLSSKDFDPLSSFQSLINVKPIMVEIKRFFGSSQLSQFMDQNNPLSEMTHKRRLSALGQGGLTRDRASFEVRDVHYTHYGRMCPIETPEGPNIGLINSLASYARINKYGFIETPYRVVDKKDPKNPKVTNEIKYLTADMEDDYHVAQANTPLDEEGHFLKNMVSGRFREETKEYNKTDIDLMDVSPKMVFSVATSMIPFLANDDANRALMGSNMQRQAVPLMLTEAPIVDTGLANKVAKDSGICQIAKNSGKVIYSSSERIEIKHKDVVDVYHLTKFSRSNQSNSYNQKPIVNVGDTVEAGDIIADGPSTSNGEIALGKNPLIGFMTWEGYNYEDAVLLSERLLKDDVYTSIHIESYEVDARETKLGEEEITNDIPNSSALALKNLGADGVVAVGTEVRAGDILVGKLTPKGETEQAPEQLLINAIFMDKAKEFRDTSLRMPHGAYGIVVKTRTFTDEEKDSELDAGVKKKVRVYVAQKRKISVGDKMAGRHGNKGVVSRILPVEDMPYLPNGRPLDIVLNPLGVPSRMNIGQILETHLSLAANVLGIKVSSPIFDGASEKEIGDMLEIANDYANTEWNDFKKKYKNTLSDDMLDYLGNHLEHRDEWKGVQIGRDGKVRLRDGRTGEYFDNPVTIGFMHYLKLHHLVDDKIHARATGPYALVTQQPLGGKAQFGGQRFGEMEVWALEAYGAAYTLQEVLTFKSDDMYGRNVAFEAIANNRNIPEATIPESFKVLLNEMKALCLDVRVYNEGEEVDLTRTDEDEDDSKTKFALNTASANAAFLSQKEQEEYFAENGMSVRTAAEDNKLNYVQIDVDDAEESDDEDEE